MSLAGIALAIAEMTDAAIVMVENAHKHLARLAPDESRSEAVIAACKEVGPPLFFSLLIITVSFLPVFVLEAQEGRMFHPLAYTKTFAMAGAALLLITLVPALILLLLRGRIPREQDNPLGRIMIQIYRPVMSQVLQWKKVIVMAAVVVVGITVYPTLKLGTEFMPTLNGLNMGADDYLAKPFDLAELEARIKALLRRSCNQAPQVRLGRLAFDTTTRQVSVDGVALALTPRELAVLEALLSRQGRPVARESLFEKVFDFDADARVEAIEIYVSRLRKKLEGSGVKVTTLRGLGYVLSEGDDA